MRKRNFAFRHSSVISFSVILIIFSLLSNLFNISLSMGNDSQIYTDLANEPSGPLLGYSDYTQYPVLIGFLLSPFLFFESFGMSPENSLQSYFSILGFVACSAIDRLTSSFGPIKKLLVIATLIPWVFMICFVFVQEDIFGLLIILSAMLTIKRNKPIGALILLSSGIVLAKLFIVFLLIPTLLLVCRNQKRIAVPLMASSPGIVVLIVSTVNNLVNGKPGFWEFELPTSLSINAWSIISGDANIYGVISWTRISLLAVVLAMCVAILLFRRISFEVEQIDLYWLTIGLGLSVLLYQFQPEYLFLSVPCVAISRFTNKEFASILLLFPLAVVQNILYGLANSSQVYNSREKVQILNQIVSYAPILGNSYLYQITAIVFSISCVAALVVTVNRSSIFKKQKEGY